MADATMFPGDINIFQYGTPSYPNPRLAAPIVAADTTITVTSPPRDKNGTIVTGKFLSSIENAAGYVETIWVPANAVSADGLTWTGVTRGVRLAGLDYTTAGTSLAADFEQDSPVSCNISAILFQMVFSAINGTIASGGTSWKIGDGTDSDITVQAYNADGNKPYFRYDKTTNEWVYSNDGVSSTPFGTGAGVTGGDGITVTAGDIDIDLTDTVVFVQTSSGAGDSGKVARLNSDGQLNTGFAFLAGQIMMYGAAAAPVGWLLCDGTAVSRATYATLFAIIGTTYGVGNGSTTFNLPDLRGRVAVGKDSGTFSSLGATGGAETHTLTEAQMPSHLHSIAISGFGGAWQVGNGQGAPGGSQNTGSAGSSQAHNNLQPYQVVNYIIKY